MQAVASHPVLGPGAVFEWDGPFCLAGTGVSPIQTRSSRALERPEWSRTFVLTTTVVVLAIVFSSGCSEPPKTNLVPVEGRVTFDGKPLASGSVSLRSESKEIWDQPTGAIAGAEGRYAIYTNGQRGAPPGTYRVVIFASESVKTSTGAAHPGMPKSLIPKRYNDPQQTPLRLVIERPAANATAPPAAVSHDLEVLSNGR